MVKNERSSCGVLNHTPTSKQCCARPCLPACVHACLPRGLPACLPACLLACLPALVQELRAYSAMEDRHVCREAILRITDVLLSLSQAGKAVGGGGEEREGGSAVNRAEQAVLRLERARVRRLMSEGEGERWGDGEHSLSDVVAELGTAISELVSRRLLHRSYILS